MSMFPTEVAAESNTSNIRTQNPQKAPKGSKRYSVPEIKDRQCLQIILEGKAKWYEIMSMFPTELASESNT